MCSSLLGLGGTHVQQSFRSRRNICAAVFCVLFPPIFMCRIFLYIQKQFNMSLLSYISYQHHAGLQPANLVTLPTVSCSRRSDLFRCSVFFRSVRFVQYVGFPLNLFLVSGRPPQKSVNLTTFRPVFFVRMCWHWTTVRTSDVTYVSYEIFQNFKFNMTYCTYMFMPDFYARFTVRPWRQLRTVRDNSVKLSVNQ